MKESFLLENLSFFIFFIKYLLYRINIYIIRLKFNFLLLEIFLYQFYNILKS